MSEGVASGIDSSSRMLNVTEAAMNVSNVRVSNHAKVHIGHEYHIRRKSTSGFERVQILDWLSKLSFRSKHEDVRRLAALLGPEDLLKHGKFSGQWLLESAVFDRWRERSLRTLWYIGMPGAGKTVLASVIIDHLIKLQTDLSPGNCPTVAFLYLSYKTRCSLTQLVGSIVRQIVGKDKILPEGIRRLWDDCSRGSQEPTETELKKLFHDVLNESSAGVYLVVDALDECPPEGRVRLLDMLPEHDKLSVLITSRYLDEFKDASVGFEKVEVRANDADLDLFIDNEFDKRSRLRTWEEEDPDIRTKVKYHVKNRCRGMFLVASLQMKLVSDAVNLTKLHHSLERLPESLEDIYNHTLDRIDSMSEEKQRIAIDTLCWVAFCRRPLTIDELRHALATTPGSEAFCSGNLYTVEDIRDYCLGLLTITQETKEVTLVHYSAQSHFRVALKARVPAFDARIVQTCITYLSFKDLGQPRIGEEAATRASTWNTHVGGKLDFRHTQLPMPIPTQSAVDTGQDPTSLHWDRVRLTREFPFVRYAAAHLRWHLQQLADGQCDKWRESVTEPLNRILEIDSKRHFLLGLMSDLDLPFFVDNRFLPAMDSFWLSGYEDPEQMIMSHVSDISGSVDEESDELDDVGEMLDMMDLLSREELELNDGSANSDSGESASHYGEESRLNAEADANHDDILLSTEGCRADTSGLEMRVDSLAVGLYAEDLYAEPDRLMDPQREMTEAICEISDGESSDDSLYSGDYKRRWPANTTASGMHLDFPWDARTPGEYRVLTALQLAAYLGWAPTVAWHAAISPDTNAKDSRGASALMIAAEEWQWTTIDVLLENGAWIDLSTRQGHAALLRCAQRDRESAIVELVTHAARCEEPRRASSGQANDLLQRVITTILWIWTAIWSFVIQAFVVVSPDSWKVSKSLSTTSGKRLKPRDMDANMQLLLAATTGDCESIASLARHKGNTISTTTETLFQSTALFLSVVFDHFDALKAMVECGMRITSASASRESTLLHEATRRNDPAVVRYLIDKGADVEKKNPQGLTAWAANLDRNHITVLRLLVEHGKADPNTRGFDGTSALYAAAAGGALEDVKFYLEIGIDPSIKTRFLWTPLHWAASNGHYLCVVELLNAGAEASPLSDTSITPLDMVKGKADRVEIEKALLARGALTASQVYENEGGIDFPEESSFAEKYVLLCLESDIRELRLTKPALLRAMGSAAFEVQDLERLFRWTVGWLDRRDDDTSIDDINVPDDDDAVNAQREIFARESEDLRAWVQQELKSTRFSERHEDS